MNMNLLFDTLGIPNENLGAIGQLTAVENNLRVRLTRLGVIGLDAFLRSATTLRTLDTIRCISQSAGYYNPGDNDIRPPVVSLENSPVRPGTAGQKRNGKDGDGSGNAGSGGGDAGVHGVAG